MKDSISVNGKGKRGRPSTGKVLFAQRVRPELAEEFLAMMAKDAGKPVVVKAPTAPVGDSGQSEAVRGLEAKVARLERELAVKAKEAVVVPAVVVESSSKDVMESNEELTEEIVKLKAALERCSMASDDQKTHWWRAKYNALYAEVTAKHGSAEFAQ